VGDWNTLFKAIHEAAIFDAYKVPLGNSLVELAKAAKEVGLRRKAARHADRDL
jgi:hypothetical protein